VHAGQYEMKTQALWRHVYVSEDIQHLRNLLKQSMEAEMKMALVVAEVGNELGSLRSRVFELTNVLKALQGYLSEHRKGMDDFEVSVADDIVKSVLEAKVQSLAQPGRKGVL
jgi:hypothetical protein